MSAGHSSLSPAGPAESPEDRGPGLCGSGENGGRYQGPGGARHGGDQPGGCSLLPQVWLRNIVPVVHSRFFFLSNLLHTSGPNISKDRRWNLVLAYNQGTLTIFKSFYFEQIHNLSRSVMLHFTTNFYSNHQN